MRKDFWYVQKRQAYHLAGFILWIEHFLLVPDPGEGPAPPLFLDQKRPTQPPPPTLVQSLEDRAPTLFEGLDPPLSVNRSSTGRETI